MPFIIKNWKYYGSSSDIVNNTASDIIYDNTNSELEADNVQNAIDELSSKTITQISEFTCTEYTNAEPEGNSYYIVQGNICYVTLNITCNTPVTNTNVITGINLPKPISSKYIFGTFMSNSTDDIMACGVNGTGDLWVRKGTVGMRYYGSFSYVID